MNLNASIGLNDAQDYGLALLNILGDFAEEKAQFHATQAAVMNVLADAAEEKAEADLSQTAILNVLADLSEEKEQFGATQRAVLNILQDVDASRVELEQTNAEIRREIENRQRAESALIAVNKELEAFSYSVAHDLRAPLRAIDGFSQALLEDHRDSLNDEGKNYLDRVRAAAQRMGQLIDDMLQLSRISRSELKLEKVDLGAMAHEISEHFDEQYPGHDVQFVVAPHLTTRADPRLIRIALENLLGNAWKFTRNRLDAYVELGRTLSPTGSTFFLRDNGAGFDMAHADRLFSPFQRLHSSKEYPGTGIGLATVQRVVNMHGGRIWAEAEAGKGATFFFSLHRPLMGRHA